MGEALPFQGMPGFPAEIASVSGSSLNRVLEGYGWQILWVAVFGLAAAFVWKSGVMNPFYLREG